MASGSTSSVPDAHLSNWLSSVAAYIKETQANCLDLTRKRIGIEELKLVLKFIPDSQVTELILQYNNLRSGMKALSETLVKSEIKKLNVLDCRLINEDLFQLMEVLKDTKITELHIGDHELSTLSAYAVNKFVSLMQGSHLKIFNFKLHIFDRVGLRPLLQALPCLSITQLRINHGLMAETLLLLLANLHCSALTDLKLESNKFDKHVLKTLSQALRGSKLEKLDLKGNDIDDAGVDILVKGLVHSKIIDLNLSSNKIQGSNTLGLRLKDTNITALSLSSNRMDHHGIFLSPQFLRSSFVTKLEVRNCQLNHELSLKIIKSLKFSKVTKLDIACNNLQLPAVSKFAKIVKDTNLEEVDFCGNKFCLNGISILGECLKASKLKNLNLSSCFEHQKSKILLPGFLEKTKGSSIDFIDFNYNELNKTGAETLALHIKNTTFTHLRLVANHIEKGVISLAENLKFTSLTRLSLLGCGITDEGVECLAQHLKETQLVDLKLNRNHITDHGAIVLALSLKESVLLYLDLTRNRIEIDGMQALAQNAANTFMTILSVDHNTRDESLLIDTVLWRNKISVHRLVSTFQQIIPRIGDSKFCFVENVNVPCVNMFLENCLELYMNIMHKPSAVRVLLEEKSIMLSKEDIISLMSEEFPKQFCLFIASSIDADVTQHVRILKKAEDFGLNKIVELLLLNRPLYVIDEIQGILHPYAYQLLTKYKYPICNLDVEPDGKMKIISYFTKHTDIEGASDVISLLRGKRKQEFSCL